MNTLYELTQQYETLLWMAEEEDMDPEVFADTLEGLEGEIEVKADGYARVIRQLEHDAAAMKAEEKRLANRRKAMESNIKRLKENLTYNMLRMDKTKFKTDLFSFSIRRNPPAVVMDEQYLENLPEEYLVQQEPTINKRLLLEDLKAGKNLEGIAHLEQSQGVQIR